MIEEILTILFNFFQPEVTECSPIEPPKSVPLDADQDVADCRKNFAKIEAGDCKTFGAFAKYVETINADNNRKTIAG